MFTLPEETAQNPQVSSQEKEEQANALTQIFKVTSPKVEKTVVGVDEAGQEVTRVRPEDVDAVVRAKDSLNVLSDVASVVDTLQRQISETGRSLDLLRLTTEFDNTMGRAKVEAFLKENETHFPGIAKALIIVFTKPELLGMQTQANTFYAEVIADITDNHEFLKSLQDTVSTPTGILSLMTGKFIKR